MNEAFRDQQIRRYGADKFTKFFRTPIRFNEDGCHEWQGARNSSGYGMFSVAKGKPVRAHRLAFFLVYGFIDSSRVVMHACNNPCCINPEHLSIGTRMENNQQSVKEKRNQHGDNHSAAKITSEIAREIFRVRNTEKLSFTQIAKRFGVTPSNIGMVIRRQTWKNATEGLVDEVGYVSKSQNGASNNFSKLNEEAVRDIRRRLANGEDQWAIASDFGITQSSVSHIKMGKTWKHV